MRFVMALSHIFYGVSCYLMFELGAYNARHPGQILEMGKQTVNWIWTFLQR